MKTYAVTITETLQRTVEVKANSQAAALSMVEDGYAASEYILDSSDFTGVNFRAKGRLLNRDSR